MDETPTCYFIEKMHCPIPGLRDNAKYCVACSNMQIAEATKEATLQQERIIAQNERSVKLSEEEHEMSKKQFELHYPKNDKIKDDRKGVS